MDRYRSVHLAICQAVLPPSTELLAHRLLMMADGVTGQINMTWEELCHLTGCENVNAARRHLTRLSAAKLIHYSTNDYVYVTWLLWMDDAVRVAEPARQRASSSAWARRNDEVMEDEMVLFGEPDAPPPARGRAGRRGDALPAARGRAARSHAGVFVSQLVDPILDEEGGNKQTNSPGIEEQRRTVALLTDEEVGLDLIVAWEFAKRYEFGWLVRQVMSWRRQVKNGMVSGSGALVHRIKEGFGASITDEDRKCALYRRHHPDWMEKEVREQREERRRSYRPEEYSDIILG